MQAFERKISWDPFKIAHTFHFTLDNLIKNNWFFSWTHWQISIFRGKLSFRETRFTTSVMGKTQLSPSMKLVNLVWWRGENTPGFQSQNVNDLESCRKIDETISRCNMKMNGSDSWRKWDWEKPRKHYASFFFFNINIEAEIGR